MGAKSTITLTREEVLGYIDEMLDKVDDRALADVLEVLNDCLWEKGDCTLGLHNFMIEG